MKEITYDSSVDITNSSGKALVFHLEPWGEQIEMAAGATFTIFAEATREGSFEIEYGADEITVWAWPTATVKVVFEGDEIGIAAGVKRPVVPDIPDGRTVRSFLRTLLGDSSDSPPN